MVVGVNDMVLIIWMEKGELYVENILFFTFEFGSWILSGIFDVYWRSGIFCW